MRRRLSRRAPESSGSRLRLSFIDVTAGGFGAAAFLAVILFAMPLSSAGGRHGSQQFIHLMVSWEDPNVLMELVIHTPAGETIRLVDDQNAGDVVNPFTGEVAVASRSWGAVLLTGESHFGRNSVVEARGARSLSLRIVAPCPTEGGASLWEFDLAVRKTLLVGTRMDQLNVPFRAELYTADSEEAGGGLVALADGSSGPQISGGQDELGCPGGSVCPAGQTGVQLHWRGPDEPLDTRRRGVPVSARDGDDLSHCEA